MIRFTFGELQGIMEGLNEIGNVKLPVKAAYLLNKIGKKANKEYMSFEETRVKLANDYCVKDEAGKPTIENGQFIISDVPKFNAEFNELASIEVTIDNINPIALSQLGDIQVSPFTLSKLEKIIFDDEVLKDTVDV